MSEGLKNIKKRFNEWSGFSLESVEKEDIISEIKTRQWDLENEIAQGARILEDLVNKEFNDE